MTSPRLLVDRDKLNSASRATVAATTVRIFDRIQDFPKEVQVLSIAAAFLLAAEASGVSPQEAWQAVSNIMRDPTHATGRHAKFAAMLYHLKTEVFA